MLTLILPALLLAWGLYELFDDDSSSDDSSGGGSSSGGGGSQEINEVTGTAGNDLLDGIAQADLIRGLDGNDTINAGAGDDGALGGNGNDVMIGGEGDDTLRGEDGTDLLIGNDGDDTLLGAKGDDWVEGDAGNDTMAGGLGSDVMLGGTGIDTIEGGTNGDILFGGSITGTPLSEAQLQALRDGTSLADILGVDGDATLAPLEDDGVADILSGEDGNDTLILGAADKAAGGAGNDSFLVLASQATANSPATISDFAEGDSVSLVIGAEEAPTVTVVDDGTDAVILSDGAPVARVAGAAGSLTVEDVALVAGPSINDVDPTFTPPLQQNPEVTETTLTAEADTFTGEEGELDFVKAEAGNDTVNGGDLADTLLGGAGDDVLIGGTGDDEVLGEDGSDLMQGNEGDDKLLGGKDGDWLNGGEGDDVLIGNAGSDVVIGGDGADDLRGNNNSDLLVGGSIFASDLTEEQLITIRDGGTVTGLTPGALEDGDADILNGGGGDDILIGAAGDQATGGDGADTFMAYNGGGAEAMIVNDYDAEDDSLAVIFEAGAAEPVITVTDDGDGVYTVLADGAPVAVVASSDTAITAADVLLVERAADGSIPG